MAPKKPTVTSSSTRSARVRGGSNPVVTRGEARTRAARTTLGPTPPQRPMASGGTKGPLQGGTRTTGRGVDPRRLEAGSSQSKPLRGMRNAATNAVNTVKTAASQVSKSGVGKTLTRLANNPAAKVLSRAAVVGGIVSELNENLNPNSAMNKRDAELLRRIVNKFQGKPAKPAAKPTASTSQFAGKRDEAFARAKAIKGSPVLGPKIVGPKKVGPGKVGTIAQAFDKAFASARKAGKSSFTFKGEKYTTEMA